VNFADALRWSSLSAQDFRGERDADGCYFTAITAKTASLAAVPARAERRRCSVPAE